MWKCNVTCVHQSFLRLCIVVLQFFSIYPILEANFFTTQPKVFLWFDLNFSCNIQNCSSKITKRRACRELVLPNQTLLVLVAQLINVGEGLVAIARWIILSFHLISWWHRCIIILCSCLVDRLTEECIRFQPFLIEVLFTLLNRFYLTFLSQSYSLDSKFGNDDGLKNQFYFI